MPIELLDWQRECLDLWFQSGSRGIVNAVTGGGKTVLALHAAMRLESTLRQQGQRLKVRIIVPKYHVLLIVDECHHCAGEINAKIFDFLPRLGEYAFRYHALALSATADRIAHDACFTAALGNIIYRYELPQALREGVVSEFMLFHVGVFFLPEEGEEHEDLSISLAKSITSARRLSPALHRLSGAAFFAKERLAADGGAAGESAAQVMRLSYRKEIVHLAENRIDCACNLVRLLPDYSKILLFGERIECAQRIYDRLCEMFPGQAEAQLQK